MYDKNGVARAVLEVGSDGVPVLFLMDKDGQGRAELSLAHGVAPFLEFNDSRTESKISLNLTRDNEANLFLYNKKEKKYWTTP